MKRKKRKKRRGVLASLRYGSKSGARSRKKKKSLPRRLLEWTAGGLGLAVMAAVIGLMLWRMFSPDYGIEQASAELAVREVAARAAPAVPQQPGGSTAEAAVPAETIVADAVVRVRRWDVAIPLTAADLERVRPGTVLSVSYTVRPFVRGSEVTIDDWRLADETSADPADAGPPSAPAPPSER